MSLLIRVYEKLFGLQHHHRNLEAVKIATQDLSKDAKRLNNIIQPFIDAEDPLETFMLEIWNKKQYVDREK